MNTYNNLKQLFGKGRGSKKYIKSFLSILMTITLVASVFKGFAIPVKASDEYDTLREKWKLMITGGDSYDTTDENVAATIERITEAAITVQSTMDKTGTKTYVWSDLNSGSVSSQLTTAYRRILSMAVAFNTYGSSLYENSALLNDITYALDWYNANKYYSGKSSYQNWWDWQIGVPLALNDITVLMYDWLSAEQITNYMDAIEYYQPTVTMTGANRLWECEAIAVRGVIVKDSDKITAATDGLSQVFDYVTDGDGFYTDGSFVQHNYYAYTGGYGKDLLEAMANLLYLVNDSSWQITDPDVSNVFQWIYDSYEPVIYKGNLMDMVRGREISRYYSQDITACHVIISAIIHLADIAAPSDSQAFKSMVKYWLLSDTTNSYFDDASMDLIVRAQNIKNNTAIVSRGEQNRYSQFAGMDRAVKAADGYSFGISMNSSRIANYESINSENAKGWHTSDGMTYLYNSDITQFNDNFWPTVNSYRLPGTTVLKDTASTANSMNDRTWVGGAEISGKYGITGMDMQDYNNTLTAKKSWFMFDDEIVALGSGINSTDGIAVESIIENRKLNSTSDNIFTVNGMEQSSDIGWNEELQNVNYMNLSGNVIGSDIGYYFPQSATVDALRESRTASWYDINKNSTTPKTQYTNSFLNLWFDHGVNPVDASYEYVILPNKNNVETGAYAANPDITILENGTDAQGVKENNLNITGVNFWNDMTKTVGSITSNRKASVITKENADDIEISVSDPTWLGRDTIDIEIDKAATGLISADDGVVVTQLYPTIKLSVSVIGANGKTFHTKLATTGTVAPLDPQTITLPKIYEAENLTVIKTSNSHSIGNSSIASGGKYDLFNANNADCYIDYKLNVPKAGTYNLSLRTLKSTSSGTYEVTIGDTKLDAVIDGYYTGGNYQDIDLGDVTFNSPGDRMLRLTCTGKNESSSGYKLSSDYFCLSLASGVEE